MLRGAHSFTPYQHYQVHPHLPVQWVSAVLQVCVEVSNVTWAYTAYRSSMLTTKSFTHMIFSPDVIIQVFVH